jgi:hypothetical protein
MMNVNLIAKAEREWAQMRALKKCVDFEGGMTGSYLPEMAKSGL